MQARIGNHTGKTTYCWIRGSKKSFPKITCFSLILLFGCATFKRPDSVNLKNNLYKICFSADGRGKISLSSKKSSFDFESLIQRDKKKWLLDFHFLGGNEKIIEVDYKKDLDQQKQSLKKLLGELGNEEFNDFLIGEFWKKMSKILQESESNNPDLMWKISQDRFLIYFPKVKEYYFRFEATHLDGFFKQIKILIESDRQISGPALELELYIDNCSANLVTT